MYIRQYKKPKSFKQLLEKEYLSDMGPGLKRGMVLSVYRARIRELTGREDFADDITGQVLTNHSAADYAHPALIVYLRPGSPWIHELHARREQIRRAINERLGCEFVREVKFK